MTQSLSALTLLVRDYDEAIAFFVGTLGFELLEDTPLDAPKRWVRVRPRGSAAGSGPSLLLARAATRASVRGSATRRAGASSCSWKPTTAGGTSSAGGRTGCASLKPRGKSPTVQWSSSKTSTGIAGI